VPVGIIPLDVAQSWQARLAAGEEVVVNLLVDSIIEERESWNIIVETKKGDPNKVVMLGAHLDGIQPPFFLTNSILILSRRPSRPRHQRQR